MHRSGVAMLTSFGVAAVSLMLIAGALHSKEFLDDEFNAFGRA